MKLSLTLWVVAVAGVSVQGNSGKPKPGSPTPPVKPPTNAPKAVPVKIPVPTSAPKAPVKVPVPTSAPKAPVKVPVPTSAPKAVPVKVPVPTDAPKAPVPVPVPVAPVASSNNKGNSPNPGPAPVPDTSSNNKGNSPNPGPVPVPVTAGTAPVATSLVKCMEDNWEMAGNNQGLVCAAKEVHLENIAAKTRGTCVPGSMVTVDLEASVAFNAGRYDVGWYIATDGGDALRGTCAIKTLRQEEGPFLLKPHHKATATVGSVVWNVDFKGGNDVCGDVVMNDGGGGVLDFMNIAKDVQIPCIDKNGDGAVDFGICFSWRQRGGDDACNPLALYPGTPAKCFCARYDIPQITVTPGTNTTEC